MAILDWRLNVLKAAYSASLREHERIQGLVAGDGAGPLGADAKTIRGSFAATFFKLNGLFREISDAIEKPDPETGWARYTELQKLMTELSNEMLAVIGGFYVKKMGLDDIREQSDNAESERSKPKAQFSFSEIASFLARDDLNERTGLGWGSVLIVGEERLRPGAADIIRLRFPALDLWHLPFAVHEYGYLMANKSGIPQIAHFQTFREDVRRLVDPAEHQVREKPEDAVCYLPKVRELWAECDEECESDDDAELKKLRAAFSQAHEPDIQELRVQQGEFLCRLYSDIFATFLVGPAYVQALLHLRFRPDETLLRLSGGSPPLALRFVFALETIRWMNNRRGLESTGTIPPRESYPFSREVDDNAGLRELFRQTVASCGKKMTQQTPDGPRPIYPDAADGNATSISDVDWYSFFQGKFNNWWTRITDGLQRNLTSGSTITATYKNWQDALDLEPALVKPGGPKNLDKRPGHWAILNAAWSRRWDSPDQVPLIYANAVSLLDPENTSFIKSIVENASSRASHDDHA